MKLEKLIFGRIVSAEPHVCVKDVAKLMRKHNVGSVVVAFRGKVLGIVTDRDIALWVGASNGKDPSEVHVGQIMTKFPLVACVDNELEPTLDRMARKGVHRVPVLDRKGNVTGVLSMDNVLALVARYTADLAQMVHALPQKAA